MLYEVNIFTSSLGVNDYTSKYRKRSCTSSFAFRFYAHKHLMMIVRMIIKWYSNSCWREIETTNTRSINLLGHISWLMGNMCIFISCTLFKLQHSILIERVRNSKSGRFTDTTSAFHFWFHVEKKRYRDYCAEDDYCWFTDDCHRNYSGDYKRDD